MENKEVFLLERVDDTLAGDSFYKLDYETADKLIAAGKAVEVREIKRIREIDNAANQLVEVYKKAVDYIRNTDEPRIANVEGQREYEIQKIKQEFEQEINELQRLKEQEIEKFYDEARRQKANAIRFIPENDRESSRILIEQLSNEARYGDVKAAINELSEQINYMSPTRKKAVAMDFSRFADVVEQYAESLASDAEKRAIKSQLRALYQKLKNINDPAFIKVRMADALKEQGATFTSYRILKLTHRTYK